MADNGSDGETITCQECGKDYKRLSGHLQVHDMSVEEYKQKYPESPTNTESSIADISKSTEKWHENNPEKSRKAQKTAIDAIDRDKQKKAARRNMRHNNPMKKQENIDKMLESRDHQAVGEKISNYIEENGHWREGVSRSEEFKNRMSELMHGNSISEESIEKIKETARKNGLYEKLSSKMKENNPMKKDAIAAKISGPNHYRWKGGASKNQYGSGWTPKKRDKVRKRDNNSCFFCGLPNTAHKLMRPDNGSLPVHHMDGDKENNQIGNLLTTCFFCHNSIHNSENLKPENLVVANA